MQLARDPIKRKQLDRQQNCLYLCLDFLLTSGYMQTYELLQKESNASRETVLADNIDLHHIFQDFEDYFRLRFEKNPCILKKEAVRPTKSFKVTKRPPAKPTTASGVPKLPESDPDSPLRVSGTKIQKAEITDGDPKVCEAGPVVRGIPDLWDEDLQKFAKSIMGEVANSKCHTCWNSIIGLHQAKALLKEAIVLPSLYPQVFQGILSPWKGSLLYGPPGTGKTLLAKAVATECSACFFNISASTLVSKWRGDSEKMVRVLFELARYNSPSIIFIDEIDCLISRRGDDKEHECARRLKTEFLIQLDGLIESTSQVFFLGATNIPWELDPALLRRLDRKILVDLPDSQGCLDLVRTFLGGKLEHLPVEALETLAGDLSDWSPSDIRLFCKEVGMLPVRRALEGVPLGDPILVGDIQIEDIHQSLRVIQPSNSRDTQKYRDWMKS